MTLDSETFAKQNIEVFTQSSIRILFEDRVIYVDPFEIKEEMKDADFVFITHNHYDHYSPDDIKKVVCEKSILVVPEKMAARADDLAPIFARIETVKPDTFHYVEDLEFETVPAYNLSKAFHPVSAGFVGYILCLGNHRVYIAGDTDATPEAKEVDCDIALVPIGGTYTMNPAEAAGLINEIQPKIAIPTHYGSVVGSEDDKDVFKQYVLEPVKVLFKKQY